MQSVDIWAPMYCGYGERQYTAPTFCFNHHDGGNLLADTHFDVLAIGNAIVDIFAHADDSFLNAYGLIKGTMGLIDSDGAKALYNEVSRATECSGGSAANTIASVVSLGGRGAFVGKVCDDHFGQLFSDDMKGCGVYFETPVASIESATATSIVLVTPDAERTMQTHLGASIELGPSDINDNDIAAAKVTFLEGYLWDPPAAKEALLKAANVAHEAGREVSLSLSDPFCVDRHREEFVDLIDSHIDILFANEDEIISLYQANTFEEALAAVRGRCRVIALTRGALGCVIVEDEDVYSLQANYIQSLVDTTGAGDAFAAGFLTGYTQGHGTHVAGRIANIAASEVISHIGARPATSLKELVAECLKID